MSTDSFLVSLHGSFVATPTHGVGKLISTEDKSALVRFFKGPSASPFFVEELPLSYVKTYTPSEQTRIYIRMAHQWGVGKYIDVTDLDERSFLVIGPDSQPVQVSVDDVEIRCDAPIDDPFQFLQTKSGESPKIYFDRIDFLRTWTIQRASATGVEGLLLNNIELMPHQLRVVRKISSDSSKRFILADEVGLGKTIEACAVIWRYLTEVQQAKIIIVVPKHLVMQWTDELDKHFGLIASATSNITIVTYDEVAKIKGVTVDMMIIDEAHRVTQTKYLSQDDLKVIVEASKRVKHILLLSATPVRSNELAFLQMLELVDPGNYNAADVESFRDRIQKRDKIALFYQLLSDDVDQYLLGLFAEELTALFPNDDKLATLLEETLSQYDTGHSTDLAILRNYISENYRVHHRLIRNRRDHHNNKGLYYVRGRRRGLLFTLEVKDSAEELKSQLIETFREALLIAQEQEIVSRDIASDLLRQALEALGTLTTQVRYTFRAVLEGMGSAFLESLGDDRRARIETYLIDIEKVANETFEDLIRQISDHSISKSQDKKIVIISNFTSVAEQVHKGLVDRWGEKKVYAHLSTQSGPLNFKEVEEWESARNTAILVCDAGAEEGTNLQAADQMIHLDLPLEAVKLEQRIGRCDRLHERNSEPIESTVVSYGYSPFISTWTEILADDFKVFDNSISHLQYAISDIEKEMFTSVVSVGHDAMYAYQAKIAGLINTEVANINAQDSLDSLNELEISESMKLDMQLIESDRGRSLAEPMISWLKGVGAQVNYEGQDLARLRLVNSWMIPKDLELTIKRASHGRLALTRKSAISSGSKILRAGHPVVDAIASHLLETERGVAFATYRQNVSLEEVRFIFRADFLVKPTLGDTIDGNSDQSELNRIINDLLYVASPPTVETICVTPTGDEILDFDYSIEFTNNHQINLINHPEIMDDVSSNLDWDIACTVASKATRDLIQERIKIQNRREICTREVVTKLNGKIAAMRRDKYDEEIIAQIEAVLNNFDEKVAFTITPLGCGLLAEGPDDVRNVE